MQESEHITLIAFRERLAAKRRRIILDEARKELLPASGFMADLANLDSTIAAVEAVIDEARTSGANPLAQPKLRDVKTLDQDARAPVT